MIGRFTHAEIEATFPPLAVNVQAAGLLAGAMPAAFNGFTYRHDLIAAAQANLPRTGSFDGLPTLSQNDLLRSIAGHPAVIALADLPRADWLRYIFAFAHAAECGATEAHDLALAWSQTSARFNAAHFERDWKSYKPRSDGITVATLLEAARDAGIDLSRWLDPPAATTVVQPAVHQLAAHLGASAAAGAAQASPFFAPVPHGQSNLHPVQWLVAALLLRGEITVIAGQGGSAKTALAVLFTVALAAGRPHVGPFTINTRPGGLRVAFISAEEDANRIGLLLAAASGVLRLTAAEHALVQQNLMMHDAKASGWRLGEPPPGPRDSIALEANDRGLIELTAALAQFKPDLLILDTFATLFALPSEIDNSAITILMRRLSRVARSADCAVLVLHHAPKMTRETAAAQRGEATLVRGGGAITNTARVVMTLTSLPADEAGQAVMQGLQPDQVRRFEHSKINDTAPTPAAYLKITSAQVVVSDGSRQAVRAVEFIPPPPAATASVPDSIRNLAMKTIDGGVSDEHGIRLPLSPGGGRDNQRDAVRAIASAIVGTQPGLAEKHARAVAKEALKELERVGCVAVQDVEVPRYEADGKPHGTNKRKGLVARWDLAPWMAVPAPSPAMPDSGAAPITDSTADATSAVVVESSAAEMTTPTL